MNFWWTLIIGSGLLALCYSFFTAQSLLALSEGNEAMRSVARAIREGAAAYLSRQYQAIVIVGVCCAGFLWWGFSNKCILEGFVIGALLSGLSGYAGMWISVRSNVRTTQAARGEDSEVQDSQTQWGRLCHAFSVAFRAGAVTGFLVNGLGLLGVAIYTLVLRYQGIPVRHMMEGLIALSLGASLICIFIRLGGGIYTKAADVGADLVGKVEAGFPEDDPRNPAVIADNVGDNVGDCAGMSADLFETYVVTLVASMQMAFLVTKGYDETVQFTTALYPLSMSAICLLACIGSTWFVRLKTSIIGALYKGLVGSAVLSGLAIGVLIWVFPDMPAISKIDCLICSYLGLITTGLSMRITEYYTACQYRPVRSIARASTTGAGTNVIQGLAVSMEACFLPVVVVCGAMLLAYSYGGLFGVSLAAASMLALMSIIVSLDAYGPVTDNAGGIAEMAGLSAQVREITDQLDAVGNTTKAMTKGYSIEAALLGVLVLFNTYIQDILHYLQIHNLTFDLSDPLVIAGLFVGGSIPYLFSSMGMKAVGRAGSAVVLEVRRQFQEIQGIMSYRMGQDGDYGRPDYGRAVDILTRSALRAMILPSLLPVFLPIGLYVLTRLGHFSVSQALVVVGSGLMGMIITGFFLAVSMTSGGGAWDNAKKYIGEGEYGGKGSPAYHAAVVGDTVGDPYKDTVGPAINPALKIANLVALLIVVFLFGR